MEIAMNWVCTVILTSTSEGSTRIDLNREKTSEKAKDKVG